MPNDLTAMKTALRVLTALAERRSPSPADIEELREIAHQQRVDTPLDEIACDVIQVALQHRESERDLGHTLLNRVRTAAHEDWTGAEKKPPAKERGTDTPKAQTAGS